MEARNVARRLGMTPEERRTTLARLTEDVAREEQLFFERASAITDEESIELDDLLRYSLPSMVGVHNISLEKLRKAIKMGGLANPSVAVIDVDKQKHDEYGEYSLILPKTKVDARQGKNAGTWAGDAWTPTYPQVIKRMTDDKAISRFYKDIDALPEAMRNRVRLDFDGFMEGRSANALAYWYLFEEGDAPALIYISSRYSDDIANAVEEATNGRFSMYGLTPEQIAKCLDAYITVKFDGDREAFEAEMQARIGRLTETIETKKSDRVKKWAQETIDLINEYGFDYDDVAKFVRDVEYDVREKGTVNVDATITAAKEQIEANNLEADYGTWRNNLDERYGIKEYIFDGYTNSGDRRYLPHTLENASKWMKKQGRQGAVATFPSFGVFVAVSIPKMTTLDSIRKRKELLGKSKEEYDAFREKWEDVYYELGKKLQPDAKSFDDYGYWRLIEAVEHKNPKEFVKKEYNIELSEEDMAKLNEMLNAIRTEYPARYFETKFERPLQLNEFVAAVVPNDIPLDVEARLRDAGVEVIEYEKGDNASRAEAMQKASAMESVRFSLRDDLVDILSTNSSAQDIAIAVEDLINKYPASGMIENILNEYRMGELDDEGFVNVLSRAANIPPRKVQKAYDKEKQTIEETFGGIWIEDTEEFAKFVSAVNTYPKDRSGEGIAFTDNFFYAYYLNTSNDAIPYAEVDLNGIDSQKYVDKIIKYGENRTARDWANWFNENIRNAQYKNNGINIGNQTTSTARADGRVDSKLPRLGRYYYTPELYSKVKRVDSGSTGRGKVAYSLITPEMDASYLDAVERGDM